MSKQDGNWKGAEDAGVETIVRLRDSDRCTGQPVKVSLWSMNEEKGSFRGTVSVRRYRPGSVIADRIAAGKWKHSDF